EPFGYLCARAACRHIGKQLKLMDCFRGSRSAQCRRNLDQETLGVIVARPEMGLPDEDIRWHLSRRAGRSECTGDDYRLKQVHRNCGDYKTTANFDLRRRKTLGKVGGCSDSSK